MSNSQCSPMPVTSGTNSGNDVEEWVDAFFTPKLEATDQSDITSLTPFCSKEPPNPTNLNSLQILKECMSTYFQVLQTHFDKNAIGGSIAFLQGRYLTDAIRDALNKSLEECDMLLKNSSCVHLKDQQRCRDRIKSQIEAVCGLFKKRNEDRRCQFVHRNVKNIMTSFVKHLERRYYFLHVPDELKDNSRKIPDQKFYEHQQMTKFVGDFVRDTVAKCDSYINKLKVSRSENSNRADDGLKLFENAKKSITRHGDELLAKNSKNQRMTQDYIEILLSTEFEQICKSEIQKIVFPEMGDVKTIVFKVKENIRKEIRDELRKNSVDTESCSMLEAEYQGRLENAEISTLNACTKLATIKKETAIKNLFVKMEEQFDVKNDTEWIPKYAKENRVPEKYVGILRNHLLKALENAKEECLGTILMTGGGKADLKQANGISSDHKTSEISVRRRNESGGTSPIDVERISPVPGSSTSSRKHKWSYSDESPKIEHSTEIGSQEKRGRRC